MANKFRRKSKEVAVPVTYCLVVEGDVERNYFESMRAEFNERQNRHKWRAKNDGKMGLKSCTLLVVNARGRSFVNVIDVALNEVKKGHERVWCVVDADFYNRLAGPEREKANSALARALQSQIIVVFSCPCFEVWYRHHFNADTSAWIDGSTAKRNIAAIWPDYERKKLQHWALLVDRLESAKRNASAVRLAHECPPNKVEERDASTAVDQMIEELEAANPNG